MSVRFISKILGAMIFFFGLSMIAPMIVALLYGDGDFSSLALSAMVTVGFGGALVLIFKNERKEISIREGFFIVAVGWFLAGLFGGLPYYFFDVFPSFTDCVFESVSGLTTTGATVLTSIEDKPHGLLFWRALTHWLGGMGIILLGIAILPLLGVGGMQLFKAEVPGPTADKIKPRVAETAKTLWAVYVLITAVEVVLLMLGGMGWFDAVCHSFATLATGGFSTRNLSIEAYDSVYFDFVIAIFMFLAGVNFALHYRMLKGDLKAWWRDAEFRFYTWLTLVCIVAVTASLYFTRVYPNLFESFRRAFFQVPTMITTTGFTSADFDKWPSFLHVLLFLLMFVGGMSGSTGGSIKIARVQLLIKQVLNELYRLVHPRVVMPLRLGRVLVPDNVMRSIWNFFTLYLLLFVVCSLIMSALGLDFVTAFTSVAATIGNVGPGLAGVGPHENFAFIPLIGKWILIFCMIVGRLEIYTVIVLLLPSYWRK
ncbi:MAG TPA: TrkH family potassium uptake protein [bacterium]|nr:TrkH family potassium uptake protein [bacterium]